jgi:hypothetical protein
MLASLEKPSQGSKGNCLGEIRFVKGDNAMPSAFDAYRRQWRCLRMILNFQTPNRCGSGQFLSLLDFI